MHLYETHIPVADTRRAQAFYCEVVGLKFAYRDAGRDIVFLWVDEKEKSMLGLWGPGTRYGPGGAGPQVCHFAFAVTKEELLRRIADLERRGIETLSFGGNPTREPSVIGWMPSAQIYFRDLDGHSLEYIAILDGPEHDEFIGSLSEWEALHKEIGK